MMSPMYLKPVRQRRSSKPYSTASASTMAEDTIVVTATLSDRSLAALAAHTSDVFEQEHAHLVAREQRVVVAVFARHAYAVGIGVGGEQQVGMHFLAQVNALLHGLADFRVGIRARGKIAIGLALPGTTVISVMPARSSTVVTGTRPVPLSGVYTSFKAASATCSAERVLTDLDKTAS